jgi:hypothetical protein
MTPEELEQEINRLLVQMDVKSKNLGKLEEIAKRSYKYVHEHWYASGVGMGVDARTLMNDIERLFPGIDKTVWAHPIGM